MIKLNVMETLGRSQMTIKGHYLGLARLERLGNYTWKFIIFGSADFMIEYMDFYALNLWLFLLYSGRSEYKDRVARGKVTQRKNSSRGSHN